MLKFNVISVDQYRAYLEITSEDSFVFSNFRGDYENALYRIGSYTSMKSNGAPTIASENLTFNFDSITTRTFSLNMVSKEELKEFTKEFNKVFEIALSIRRERQLREKQEAAIQAENKKKNDDFIDTLNDFLNN